MELTKFEKAVYTGCPWLFGMVMTVSGIVLTSLKPARLHGVLLASSGLVCMSLYCVCSLLVKLVTEKKD